MAEPTLKNRCQVVMETHLKTKGYPNMTFNAIIKELPRLWKALDAEGLTEELKAEGHTFEEFCRRAHDKAQEISIFAALRDAVEGRR